jgi:uncharacterized metal-binding protein YceD (DUF177 family)
MKPPRATIDIAPVLATGRELAVREQFPLPDFGDFRFPAPAAVDLRINRAGRGIEILGTLDAVATGECARCLDEVNLPVHVEVDEQLEPTGDTSPLGENNVWTGDEIDVADLVRQSIDTALPMLLLCHEACRGLCPDCGNKRDGACPCAISEN